MQITRVIALRLCSRRVLIYVTTYPTWPCRPVKSAGLHKRLSYYQFQTLPPHVHRTYAMHSVNRMFLDPEWAVIASDVLLMFRTYVKDFEGCWS
jgi:hypothetical protein